MNGASWALAEGDAFRLARSAPYAQEWQLTNTLVAAEDAVLLAPVTPRTIIGAGRTYPAPGVDLPDAPRLFAKLPSSIIGPGQQVRANPAFQSVMAEGELVLVIGRTLQGASLEEAEKSIFGVTAGNDITGLPVEMDRLLQIKAADTFAPVGPCIATGLDINALDISISVNGQVAANGNSRDHASGFGALLSEISRYFTLQPGDIVFTGSPAIVPEVLPTDIVDIHIAGIGTLSNMIA
ncbi:MAG: fumarylacetoacetate hydrolase family protein [Pseudomonadota bacterium]